MYKLLQQVLLVCVCVFAMAGQALADSFSDAKRAYDAGNYAEAVKLFKPLADKGNALAQINLGLMYGKGQGVTQDFQESMKWYRLAAEQGNAQAQTNIGVMYSNGQGVPQDYKEAAKWYRLAAEQGDASAQVNLGLMYGKGQGIPRDYVKSHMWLHIATTTADSEEQKEFINLRDSVATLMTTSQIAESQERARGCFENRFKGC